ncbi:MAG: hypothetical protein AAF413_04050, partial [Patescibacteria group bacterium]
YGIYTMSEISHVRIGLGFTESKGFGEPLLNAMIDSLGASDGEVVLLADVAKKGVSDEGEDWLNIGRSAFGWGCSVAMRRRHLSQIPNLLVVNPVEPTPLPKLVRGSYVGFRKDVITKSRTSGAGFIEPSGAELPVTVLRNALFNMSVPVRVRKFSTADFMMLAALEGKIPGHIGYLSSEHDEFTFHDPMRHDLLRVRLADRNPSLAVLNGEEQDHGWAMYNPSEAAEVIVGMLENAA